MTLLEMRINSFLLIMPTLVLGIGVDDAFLLVKLLVHNAYGLNTKTYNLQVHAWSRHAHLQPRTRLIATLVDVGPSMTITTVTNVWYARSQHDGKMLFACFLARLASAGLRRRPKFSYFASAQ